MPPKRLGISLEIRELRYCSLISALWSNQIRVTSTSVGNLCYLHLNLINTLFSIHIRNAEFKEQTV